MQRQYLDLEESNHRGAKMHPTVLQGYICALRRGRQGPDFFIDASNMSLSIVGISITSISIIGILTL